jgi:hypothetical protein
MCIPKALENVEPTPIAKKFKKVVVEEPVQKIICDADQYAADMAAVLSGRLAQPVTKAGRLELR